mmetsp:Transcript_28068/g.74053  ORF Transcript_28068/g.74053 Transcript_28068/m.74053 type:complete len:83 (+) Transcript_28068:1440-1688(+)
MHAVFGAAQRGVWKIDDCALGWSSPAVHFSQFCQPEEYILMSKQGVGVTSSVSRIRCYDKLAVIWFTGRPREPRKLNVQSDT